jgi:excisionase family DNA binding protein
VSRSPLLTVEEAAQRARFGRTMMYDKIRTGEIRSIKIGRLRRIPSDAVDEYIDGLVAAQCALDAA